MLQMYYKTEGSKNRSKYCALLHYLIPQTTVVHKFFTRIPNWNAQSRYITVQAQPASCTYPSSSTPSLLCLFFLSFFVPPAWPAPLALSVATATGLSGGVYV
jgi:hypothetical protein